MKRALTIFSALMLTWFFVSGQGLYFPPLTGNTWDTMAPKRLGWCQSKIDSLYRFLDSNNTKSFILLKDGKIVLEQYLGGQTATSPWYWASAGKSLTAFLIGLAQQDGYLQLSDTTSQYLGQGWTVCPPEKEEKITIRHQLTMTSGLNDAVPDHYCTLDTCLQYKADAGTRWAYHNGPYTLLDSVLETATGYDLNTFAGLSLKPRTGMTGSFVTVDYNHVFFSTARSMARYGLLILNRGNWNGDQVMTDTAYFREMTHTSQNLNQGYGYLWWLNGSSTYMLPQSQYVFNGMLNPHAPVDMIAALGKNGQFLNVAPSQNLVWLRMGDDPGGSEAPVLLNDRIWEYINDLGCSSAIGDPGVEPGLTISVDRSGEDKAIRLACTRAIREVVVYDLTGRVVGNWNGSSDKVSIQHLRSNGSCFLLKIITDQQQALFRKVLI
jgi:CubicO group peptidase (beta-lactamase class C family)